MGNKLILSLFFIILISINVKNFVENSLVGSGLITELKTDKKDLNYIAHAGGGIDGLAYTNSVNAIQNSLSKNFKLIELDLLLTKDEMIIASHDWKSFESHCGKYIEKKKKYYYKDFIICNNKLGKNNEYQLADENYIRKIFDNHKNYDFILVTDQIQNFKALKSKFSGYENRMIVEAHSIFNYINAKRYFPLVALTHNDGRRYKYIIDFLKVKMIIIRSSLVAKYKSELNEMINNGLIVLSNTSNDRKFIDEHLDKQVNIFYTDFWDINNHKCTEKIKDKSNNSPCHSY